MFDCTVLVQWPTDDTASSQLPVLDITSHQAEGPRLTPPATTDGGNTLEEEEEELGEEAENDDTSDRDEGGKARCKLKLNDKNFYQYFKFDPV